MRRSFRVVQAAQNLRQLVRAELAGSAGPVGILSQSHRVTSLRSRRSAPPPNAARRHACSRAVAAPGPPAIIIDVPIQLRYRLHRLPLSFSLLQFLGKWGNQQQRYDIKSATKSFGATMLGVALKDRKMELHAPARRYHPTFGIPPKGNEKMGWLDDVSLFHLVTQTAGFEILE